MSFLAKRITDEMSDFDSTRPFSIAAVEEEQQHATRNSVAVPNDRWSKGKSEEKEEDGVRRAVGSSSDDNAFEDATAAAKLRQRERDEEETKKREKLLFLLEVASDPKITGLGSGGAYSSPYSAASSPDTASSSRGKPSVAAAAAAAPRYPAATKRDPERREENDEEARRKRRRIQYALSVLSAGRDENQRRIQLAIEEAKRKRAASAISSLTGRNASGAVAAAGSGASPKKQQKDKASTMDAERVVGAALSSRPESQRQGQTQPGSQPQPAQQQHEQQQAQTQPKRRHVRKRTFAEKLMDVLSRPECEAAISWLPAGDSFVIVSPKRFVSDVLPLYFKEAKFESFTRKLNRWGFKRISRAGTHAVAYTHHLFRRDRPDLCKNMTGGKKDGSGGGEDMMSLEAIRKTNANLQPPKTLPEEAASPPTRPIPASSAGRVPLDLDKYIARRADEARGQQQRQQQPPPPSDGDRLSRLADLSSQGSFRLPPLSTAASAQQRSGGGGGGGGGACCGPSKASLTLQAAADHQATAGGIASVLHRLNALRAVHLIRGGGGRGRAAPHKLVGKETLPGGASSLKDLPSASLGGAGAGTGTTGLAALQRVAADSGALALYYDRKMRDIAARYGGANGAAAGGGDDGGARSQAPSGAAAARPPPPPPPPEAAGAEAPPRRPRLPPPPSGAPSPLPPLCRPTSSILRLRCCAGIGRGGRTCTGSAGTCWSSRRSSS